MKISKSISLKVSLGNYQMADFFVSAEAETVKGESMETLGESLHEYCKSELTKDVNNSKKYLQDLANGKVEEKKVPDDVVQYGLADPYSDPASDLLGEYPGSMNPPRKDKKV